MRRVDRSAVEAPASLGPGKTGAKELVKARAHQIDANPEKGSFTFKAYKRADVKAALEALFHGKCAYCETFYASAQPPDVEHYRPKGAVAEDEAHGGHWWIAMAWDNLLPSCIDCNRKREQRITLVSDNLEALAANAQPVTMQSGKQDSFPLAATGVRALAEAGAAGFANEAPLLLDPSRDDPAAFLAYHFDPGETQGLVLPAGELPARERGAVSIQVYGLNRRGLVQDRTRLLRQLEFLGHLVIELSASIEALEAPAVAAQLAQTPAAGVSSRLRLLRDATLAEIRSSGDDDAPFAAMARAWIADFGMRVSDA